MGVMASFKNRYAVQDGHQEQKCLPAFEILDNPEMNKPEYDCSNQNRNMDLPCYLDTDGQNVICMSAEPDGNNPIDCTPMDDVIAMCEGGGGKKKSITPQNAPKDNN